MATGANDHDKGTGSCAQGNYQSYRPEQTMGRLICHTFDLSYQTYGKALILWLYSDRRWSREPQLILFLPFVATFQPYGHYRLK
jgi:hypothetical protein